MLLLAGAAVDGVAQTVTFETRVLSGSDDAEERASGSVKLGSGDLELTFDRGDQTVGMRFTGLNIPPGATINNRWTTSTRWQRPSPFREKFLRMPQRSSINTGIYRAGL